MSSFKPVGITADRNERVVIIQWDDGKECRYPFAGLRAVCPCVACKGGHANMGRPPDPNVVRTAQDDSLTLEQLQAVGSYALQFFWGDGHSTGIYTWEMLRQACP